MSVNRTIMCYFKIAFSEETTTLKVPLTLTITTFLQMADEVMRELFDIHPKYIIEVVETNSSKGEYGPALLPDNSQTLEQRYRNTSIPIGFYVRPVDSESGLFVQQSDYSE